MLPNNLNHQSSPCSFSVPLDFASRIWSFLLKYKTFVIYWLFYNDSLIIGIFFIFRDGTIIFINFITHAAYLDNLMKIDVTISRLKLSSMSLAMPFSIC